MYKADRLFNEILETERQIERTEVKDEHGLVRYFKLYTSLIFDYKELGNLYDIYADDVVVHRENGRRLDGAHAVMKDAAVFAGSFPDLKVAFVDAFAVPHENGYKLWRHYCLEGTNLNASIYGPPTGKRLERDKCLVMNMATVEMRDDRPQIVREFTMYSAEYIRQICTAEGTVSALLP